MPNSMHAREHWRQRQNALGLYFGSDHLESHEIEFYESFLRAGHRIRPILRDPNGLPTNDFVWRGIEVELKSPASPSYIAAARLIRYTVRRARAAGVCKDTFMIDLRAQPLTPRLSGELAGYNQDYPLWAVSRMFVWHATGLEEIDLAQ